MFASCHPNSLGYRSLVFFVLATLCLQTVHAATPVIPDGGTQMINADNPAWISGKVKITPAKGSAEKFTVQNMPFKHAIRVTSKEIQKNPWDAIVHVRTNHIQMNTNDVCLLSFWMRSPWSEDESGDGVMSCFVEYNTAPHYKIAKAKATAGRDWRLVTIPFAAAPTLKTHFEAGEVHVSLHMGMRPQQIELGGFSLINYKDTKTVRDLPRQQITYPGREPDAAWRKDAAKRIEQYRKADLSINVTDAQGKPIKDADIHVQMTRHAFRFGAAVTGQMLGMDPSWSKTAGDHKRYPYTESDVHQYRKIVEDNFNWVVLENDFKYGCYIRGIENTEKDIRAHLFRQDWLENALTWLNDRDIKVRGHRLFNGRMPRHVKADPKRKAELRKRMIAQAKDKATWAGKRVTEWDCLNHPMWGSGGPTLLEFLDEPDFYAQCFAMGRAYAPHAQLWTNEGHILVGDGARAEPYLNMIKDLIKFGQRPDGIGFMGHYNTTSIIHPQKVYERMEQFAPYADRLQYTELDFSTNDDQLQADYLRDMMIIAYS
ncbi:MAG: endo-1,4-beta-xylanase, partial [Phycisphaeraceae bacterium JB051]